MDPALQAAAGALLVAVLNELRAQLRAREANRDRQELQALRRRSSGASDEEPPDVDER